jgi:hypothetical protein
MFPLRLHETGAVTFIQPLQRHAKLLGPRGCIVAIRRDEVDLAAPEHGFRLER